MPQIFKCMCNYHSSLVTKHYSCLCNVQLHMYAYTYGALLTLQYPGSC